MGEPCFLADVKPSEIDKALTSVRVSAIWRYAKAEYIDKGKSYEDTLTGMANDLQVPRDVIARAFAKPKSLRPFVKEMYAKQQARHDAVRMAKIHVATLDEGAAYKLVTTLTSIPRRVLTFGHGPVFPVTHALDLAGSEPRAYFQSVANAWKFASKSSHAAALDWLRNHDLYADARKSGLAIDPEQGPSGILIGGSGGWARRSWDALKVSRLSLFEQRWLDVPEAERTPEMAKQLSRQINHSTGVMSPDEWSFGGISKGMFAPQLTASKIQKTFIDPKITAQTWMKVALGHDVPFEERYIASLRTRKSAQAVATYASLLAVNQGFLAASGSKDRVNFTDPTKSDWLRPKAFGHTLNTRGTMEEVRIVGNLIAISKASRKQLHGDSRTAAGRDVIARYLQYKAAPLVQLGYEGLMREDPFGRPVPWSDQPGTRSKPKYTWPEYTLEKGPIYLEGAAREVYDQFRQHGISASDAMTLMRSLAANPEVVEEAALVGATEFIGGGISKVRPQRSSGGALKPAF